MEPDLGSLLPSSHNYSSYIAAREELRSDTKYNEPGHPAISSEQIGLVRVVMLSVWYTGNHQDRSYLSMSQLNVELIHNFVVITNNHSRFGISHIE